MGLMMETIDIPVPLIVRAYDEAGVRGAASQAPPKTQSGALRPRKIRRELDRTDDGLGLRGERVRVSGTMCVKCIYIYILLHIHTHIYIYILLHIHIYIYIYVYIYIYLYLFLHVYAYAYV